MLDKTKVRIIEQIIKLRIAQILINERYKNGDFKIPIHLAMGHETLAVAVSEAMQNEDSLVLTHRNIHYNLARMGTLKEELDEYYLKETGLAQGRLGSMNLSNPTEGVIYSSSILGNNLPVAAGFALGNKSLGRNSNVVFVATGDGAIEEGAFYESLLFMKSNHLNIVIIVENNQWSLGTKIDERRCAIDLNSMASSFDMEYFSLTGNDPFSYSDLMAELRQKVSISNTPFLVEVNLTTLGHWYMETKDFPNGKFINYHAGPAPKVNLADYPLISQNNDDPLFVLKEYLCDDDLSDISARLLAELEEELL